MLYHHQLLLHLNSYLFCRGEFGSYPYSQPERFNSPDAPLTAPELDEEKPSLVASARKEVVQEEILEEEIKETPSQRYPGMSAMNNKGNRVLKSRPKRNTKLKSKFVISELVRPKREGVNYLEKQIKPLKQRMR